MNAKIIFMISVVLLMFAVGTVNAGDVENLTDSDALASIDEVDVSDDAEGLSDNEVLNSADDEDILGGISDNIQINYYDLVADNPHSVNIYNESDYVARIYAPTGSAGTVHLSIGESDDDADEIFNSSIQDLDKVIDENNPYYSYYYIRPAESVGPVDPGIYYVLVEYKVSSFTDYNYNYVHFVEDSRHVRVEDIYEIVIGDDDNDHINIYVEGTRGYLRVLVDNVEVMHDSVFNLSYDEETDEFRYYIPVYMDDLSVGKHTYTVSYYGGNWDDVTISDEIDVTYLLEVYPEESEVYYGDDVTFSIFLPDDASSDEIKVNDVTYEIDVDYGVASLTLSDLEVGENILVFTYDDVKYGEKSYTYELYVNPKLYIPETVRYASDDKIILKLPSDARGKLNIFLEKGDVWELNASKDVVNGEVNFTFDSSSWEIGSYYILVEFESENYMNMSNEAYLEIIPNVEMPKALYVDDEYNVTIILPEMTMDTLIVKILNESDERTIYNELSNGQVNIPVPELDVGDYELQVIYQKFNGEIITSTYPFDVRSQSPNWTIEAELEDFNIFSNDYAYGQIKNLPNDADGLLTLYIDGEKVDVFNSRYIQEFIKFDGYDFDLGTHNWEVKFDSDSYYKDSSASGTFEVLWIDVPDIVYPGIENHNSIVFLCNFDDISGYLSLKVDGEEYALEFVKNGTVIYLDDLEYGVYDYEIVLIEDKFGSLTKRGSFKVEYYFDVEVNGGNPVYAGIPFAVDVKAAKDATGNVTIDVGGTRYTQNIVNGSVEFEIDELTPGNYTLAVNYSGDGFFPSQEITRNLTVNGYKIVVEYINAESDIIKSVSLNLPANASGNLVIYNQTGSIGTVHLENGSAKYEFNIMEFGKNYSGYILYDGVDYDVERLDYNFNLSAIVDVNDTLVIGENAYVSVDMFGISGNITVYVNNVSLNETLVNGKINVTIPSASMHLGNNIVTLRYEGSDLDYNPFDSDEYVIVVGPKELTIPDEFSDGAGNITLELPDGSSGNVTVYVNGELVSTTSVSGGKKNIPVNVSEVGDNTVKVCYTDDKGYSYEVTKTVNVPKPVPQVGIVTPSDSTVPVFTINLPNDAKGSLIVNIAGENYVKELVNGKATISVPGLADGVYDAIIKYSGDSKYAGFSRNTNVTIKTVPLKDPKLTIKVPNTYQANKPVITVTTDNTFTGKVMVTIKSKTYTVNLVKGKGTISISGLGVGTYTAKAIFVGNSVFKSSIKSVNFKVKANVIKLTLKKVKIKKSAKKLIIKATLKINGKAVKGKKLKFKFNKKTYNAKTNKKGVAKITIKKKILKKLKVGKKVKYQVKYGKKTVKRTVKVRR